MNAGQKSAVVAGVGPGLGEALCRRLSRAGYEVAGLARNDDFLSELEQRFRGEDRSFLGVSCDITDAEQIRESFDRIERAYGLPRILIYNAGAFLMKELAQTSDQEFRRLWEVNCRGAYLCARHVTPGMLRNGGGTILFTGATASVKPAAQFSAFGSSKFALRGLAHGLARELGPQGIHVGHVVIDGVIWMQRTRSMPGVDEHNTLQPEDIAETYMSLIRQPRSAWTLELDIRPDVESF